MADVETTVSPVPELLVHNGLKLKNAARGVYFDTSANLSGAVSSLDFAGESIKRYTVTGNLSGAFATPPLNIPTLEADNQSTILTIIFFQDSTGGRTIDLDALFANYEPYVLGLPIVDEAPGGATVVDIVARRASGTTTYTVNFSQSFDAGQIDSGVMDAARLPNASAEAKGVVMLAPGSGGAAKGDHVHAQLIGAKLSVAMSGGGTLTNGDYEFIDVPTAGTVVRLAGARLLGGTNPTGTASLKIGTTTVTGTGVAVTGTAAADANATAANTFVARQKLSLTLASLTGSPTGFTGYVHYTITTEPWEV